MLFLQLPPTLPIIKTGHEGASSSGSSRTVHSANKTCGLTELPAGLMGKMLVYKSGAVKLKLGDTIYDVSDLTIHRFLRICPIFCIATRQSRVGYWSEQLLRIGAGKSGFELRVCTGCCSCRYCKEAMLCCWGS